MRHTEVIEALAHLEQSFPVGEWCVGDLHVWPFVRIRLGLGLLAYHREGVQAMKSVRATGFGRVRTQVRDVVRDLTFRGAASKADVVCLGRPGNRQLVGDSWYDRMFDPLIDIVEADGGAGLLLEYRSNGGSYKTPRRRPALTIRRAIHACQIRAVGRMAISQPNLPGYRDFANYVQTNWVGFAAPTSLWIHHRGLAIAAASHFFEPLIEKIEPQLLLCGPYYNTVGLAFCVAANRLRIPSVDVQHGVTTKNPAYDGWTVFPSSGYASLPKYFWTWSARDARPVDAWPHEMRSYHRTVVGGHPWQQMWEINEAPHRACDTRARELRGPNKTILVSLTWSSGWSDQLRELVLRAPSDWTWWVRLHPLMENGDSIRRWAARHALQNLVVDEATSLPLPVLLRHADVHVTHNSTVIQEAEMVGVMSVIIDRQGLDVYEESIGSGSAVFADGSTDIVDAIANAANGRRAMKRWPNRGCASMASVLRRLMQSPCPELPTAS